MYHIEKNGIAFFTDNSEKALQYMKDGYSVHEYTEMQIDSDGKLQRIEENKVTGGVGIITSDQPNATGRNEEK